MLMTRTAIMIPQNLKLRAEEYATHNNISFAEVIRESLAEKLDKNARDPFFDDTEFYSGKTSTDLSINHDKYLYD